MHASALLLSLAGLVAADMVRFESDTSPIGHVGGLALRASGTCDIGTACGSSCIPIGARCCSRSDGTYCRVGYRCIAEGCCPVGKICSGPPVGGCDEGRVLCGKVCVPKGSQCCSRTTGAFCIAGTRCVGTTRCDAPQGSGSVSGPGSGSGSGSRSASSATTTSDIFGGVATTQGSGATNTYSLSPSTTTADSSGSGSGSGSRPGSSSASTSVSGDSTTTASGASSTDDRSQPSPSVGLGATNSPRILLGLLAAVLLLI